ncbi:hypothetical protein [Novosphingobium naphthalenivorans]|uniref:hypothetical protein n=1 Tax=Novosphingobium naphthalenivorans TaxID=273168 RepID=UPI0012ECFD23|nr:hypothetical protein [Novosphingobium naphthalenivorans]
MLALPTLALAQSTQLKERTYRYAIRCYVANAVASTDPRYGAKAEHFRAMKQKSHDTALTLGRMLGKSDASMEEDFASNDTILRGAFQRDDSFFQKTRQDCAEIKLM